jgi:hypothetical protein
MFIYSDPTIQKLKFKNSNLIDYLSQFPPHFIYKRDVRDRERERKKKMKE